MTPLNSLCGYTNPNPHPAPAARPLRKNINIFPQNLSSFHLSIIQTSRRAPNHKNCPPPPQHSTSQPNRKEKWPFSAQPPPGPPRSSSSFFSSSHSPPSHNSNFSNKCSTTHPKRNNMPNTPPNNKTSLRIPPGIAKTTTVVRLYAPPFFVFAFFILKG